MQDSYFAWGESRVLVLLVRPHEMPPTPSPRSRTFLGFVLTAGTVVLFCLGLFWRDPLVFWKDDYQISILPVFSDVARSWQEGHWPLLSPYSWACGNLAGEYQYGTFSLFVNAVVVAAWHWPLSYGARAAALSITHLAVLAAGAFMLARQRRLPSSLAAMVGIVSALNGWEIGWGATDWFGALAAHAWLPWAWWAFEVSLAPRSGHQTLGQRLRLLLPAPFVYLVLAGGFPYTVVMLGLVTGWLALRVIAEHNFRALLPLVLGWLCGLGLSAPAWLSLLEAMHGSGRAEGVGPGNHAWTVPLSALPGMVLPSWSTSWHNFADQPGLHAALELAGALVPVIGLGLGIVHARARLSRVCRWDFLLLGTVLLFCLLPSPGVFRWSFRWLPLLHIILALVGAHAWELVWIHREESGSARLLANGGLWASAVVAIAWLAMAVFRTGNPDSGTRWLPAWTLACTLAWAALEAPGAGRTSWRPWLPAFFALLTLWTTYSTLPTNPGVPRYAFDAGLERLAPLSADRLYVSFYREPEHEDVVDIAAPSREILIRPGSTNLFAGLRFVNGYSPIMGAGIGREWKMKTHGEILPEMGRELLVREAGPADELARIGVDGLVIARNYPIDVQPPSDEWTRVFSSPDGSIYHRRGNPLPPVAVVSAAGNSLLATLTIIENSRSRVVADLPSMPNDTPASVVFHRPYFPGYVASLDGKKLVVQPSAGGLMPSVRLPAGGHGRLVLDYRPRAIVYGVAGIGITLLAMAVVAGWAVRATRLRGR